MDRLAFFKHGLSSVVDAASSLVGLKKAVESFTDVVDEALSEVSAGIGLSTSSFDSAIYEGADFAFSQFAAMGYTALECGRYTTGRVHDIECGEFCKLASKHGLRVVGGHLNRAYEPTPKPESEDGVGPVADKIADERGEVASGETVNATESPSDIWWKRALDDHKAMRCKYVVMSEFPQDIAEEDMVAWAEYFNHVGSLALERELKFCFHPNDGMLKTQVQGGEKSLFDILVEKCDPEKVWFAIDTYECAKAEVDTCSLLTALGQRVYLLHLHDYGIACESGNIDFEAIATVAGKQKIENMIVEVHTFSLPPMNCAERSLFNLETIPSIRY